MIAHKIFALAVAFAAAGACAPDRTADAAQARSASDSQSQRVVLITGSTDGLGRELAFRIGGTGAHVIVHGRNRERGKEVVDSISRLGNGASARFYAADFGTFAEVRAMGDSILKDYPRIDLLINNAGIWLRTATSRQLSTDGNELTFQVNYLSHVLLTQRLLPLLTKPPAAGGGATRIINVASRAQTAIDLDDVNQERNFAGQRGYGTSKLAQVMYTVDLARELESAGVLVYAVHPASQMDTYMVRAAGNVPRSTIDEGAASVMNLVTGTGIPTGSYYDQLTPGRASAQAYDTAARARLREITMRLIGETR